MVHRFSPHATTVGVVVTLCVKSWAPRVSASLPFSGLLVCVCVCSFELGGTPARPGGAPRPLLVPNPRFIGLRAGARSWGDHGPGRPVSYCHAIAWILAEREQSPRLPPISSPSRHLSLPRVLTPSLAAGDGPLAPGQRCTLGQANAGEAKP